MSQLLVPEIVQAERGWEIHDLVGLDCVGGVIVDVRIITPRNGGLNKVTGISVRDRLSVKE